MSGRRLIVVESNEVPPHIFRWYATQFPASAIARLVWEGALHATTINDQADLGGRELYPSQAWATVATGAPFADHGVYWYGDPKPVEYPLYWQLAAAGGRTVGLVGTLHSSPLAEQAADPNIVFAIPDCFAADDAATPRRYRDFQRLNLAMTRGSGRVVAAKPGPRNLLTLATSWSLGVRPRSLTTLAKLGAGVAVGRVPRERLRAAQFVMQADIFQTLVWKTDPDLAVLFTNHVASMMHRYWFATFPGDWAEPLYDAGWIARYGDEIAFAMHLLDRTIAELRTHCEATDRALVVMSGMGQVADTTQADACHVVAIVRDAERFVDTISDSHLAVLPGMVPQVSAVYASADEAMAARSRVESSTIEGLHLWVDQAGEVLTFSYQLVPDATALRIDGRTVPFDRAGVTLQATDDHRSGVHHPLGSLFALGLDLETEGDAPLDVLHLAPTILDALGVDRPAHHRESRLRRTAVTRA